MWSNHRWSRSLNFILITHFRFEAVMDTDKSYFTDLRDSLQKKRDKLCSALSDVGLVPISPEGSYFVLADFSKINTNLYYNSNDSSTKDYQFCRWLVKNVGVAAIPPTAFYSQQNSHIASHLARFCFIKKDETLDEAIRRLQKLKQLNNQ